MIHGFDSEVAKKIGIREAIFINSFSFWHTVNKGNNNNFFDNHYWTYMSVKAFQDTYPYMTQKQIRHSLDNLIRDGYLLEGNYNTAKYDRTKWYSITDKGLDLLKLNDKNSGQMDLPPEANGFATQGEPIPVSTHLVNTKEIYKEKIIETTRTFYKTEIEQNSGHQHIEGYKQVANFIFLKNPFGKPIVCILSLEEQLKFSDYLKILDKNEYNVTGILDMLANMANTPSYTKGKVSLFLTLNNWINREKKKK